MIEPVFIFLRVIPIVDAGICLAIVIVTAMMWSRADLTAVGTDVGERSLGATAVLGQLTGTITAGTIILGGIGAVAALGKDVLTPAARWHLMWGAASTLMSLFIAVWALGTIPPMVPRDNPARSKPMALLAVAMLCLFAIGAIRFGLALWHLLKIS